MNELNLKTVGTAIFFLKTVSKLLSHPTGYISAELHPKVIFISHKIEPRSDSEQLNLKGVFDYSNDQR